MRPVLKKICLFSMLTVSLCLVSCTAEKPPADDAAPAVSAEQSIPESPAVPAAQNVHGEPPADPEYMDLRGEIKSIDEMEALATEHPGTEYAFSFEFAGIRMDSTVTELDIHGIAVESTEYIRRYLVFMPKLKYIDMCGCGLSNEEMAGLREEYPDIKFVWMLQMDIWQLRTDTVAFSTLSSADNPHKLTSADIDVLRYCTDLTALDLGHHEIDDISVLYELPDLRILILADNLITDITPIASLKNLRYLEIFMNYGLTNLSPLLELHELVDLNVSGLVKVEDFSCLADLTGLERLWINYTCISRDDENALKQKLVGCQICIQSYGEATAGGWRDHERYDAMRDMFFKNYLNELFI